MAGRKPNLVEQPMLDADVKYTYADISKARRLLDYDPKVGVAEGTQRFFEWYVANVKQ
jgi:UDP-glucuronate 4-epimerase